MKRLSLRSRLTIALIAISLFAVALAALIGNIGLNSRLEQAARSRLVATTQSLAILSSRTLSTAPHPMIVLQSEITDIARFEGLRVSIDLTNGLTVRGGEPVTGTAVSRHIIVDGRPVGVLRVATSNGLLLTPGDVQLGDSLNRLHLVAAAVALLVALVTSLLLSETLSRPLRHVRDVAEHLTRGDLDARVQLDRVPETAAVGRTLNTLAEKLQWEEELRKESVGDLAHELRTPVNAILSRVEAVQDGLLPAAENLEVVHGEALRLTHLLDDLARLADAQQLAFDLDRDLVDVANVVHAATRGLSVTALQHGVELDATAEPAYLTGDALRLEQVVLNLLSNAIHATPRGGRVSVFVSDTRDDVTITVRDTGCGIAAEDIARVFTRFWRADRARSRATGGSGIGLTIVSEIVRAHGGRIDIESRVGEGTAISVHLPHDPPHSAVEPAARRDSSTVGA